MDAVYILGTGSLADNKEILYSVRSLQENMLDLENVYVVGEQPDRMPGLIHIAASDLTEQAWKNVYSKICKACATPEVSADFLLMNDDFFMLAPFTGADWPFYSLKGSNGGACGPHSYHVHAPMKLNKEMFLKMPFAADGKVCKSPRTFYANFYGAPPKTCDDFIVPDDDGGVPFATRVAKLPCFSVSDGAMQNDHFVQYLEKRFSRPSGLEIA